MSTTSCWAYSWISVSHACKKHRTKRQKRGKTWSRYMSKTTLWVWNIEKEQPEIRDKNGEMCSTHKKQTLSGTWQGQAWALNLMTWIKRKNKVRATMTFRRWICEKEEKNVLTDYTEENWGKDKGIKGLKASESVRVRKRNAVKESATVTKSHHHQFNWHCRLHPVLTTAGTRGGR